MASAFKLTIAALLVGSVLAALLGPPPRRRAAMRLRGSVLAGGMAGYVIAGVALTTGAVVGGAVALAVAGELVCAAGWLGRGDTPPTDDEDGGGGGGGGGGGRGPKPPPSDWDAFEQAFRRYARERERQPV